MARFHNTKFVVVLCVTLIVLLACSGAFAQNRIARANQAAEGQTAFFRLVGNSQAVCVNLAQIDDAGNLWTFSSYYLGALATKTVAPPVIAHFKTTAYFSISEVLSQSPGTACGQAPGAFLDDPTREPQIYESLVGGKGITVNQVNAALSIQAALCSANQSQSNTAAIGVAGAGLVVNQNVSATQINAQIGCLALQNSNITQLNFSQINGSVVLGFEEIAFTDSKDALTSALAGCVAAYSQKFDVAGASWTLTCKPPTGGTFSDQSFH